MKNLFLIFTIVFIQFANATTAQNSSCNFIGTQWKIKRVVIKKTGTSFIEDSLYYEKLNKNYDSTRLEFCSKNRIRVLLGKRNIKGKYSIISKEEGAVLKIFPLWRKYSHSGASVPP
jgi:hypothetical protein